MTWDLSKLIEVGKVYELSDNTALDIECTTEKVNELKVAVPVANPLILGASVQHMEKNAITVALEIILQVQRNALQWAKIVSGKPNHLQENVSQKCLPK